MPKVAELKPVKLENGKWLVDISAKYSNTGKRRRLIFTSEAKAQAEVRRLKSHVHKHGLVSIRFTDEESADASTWKASNLTSRELRGDRGVFSLFYEPSRTQKDQAFLFLHRSAGPKLQPMI